MFHSKHSCSSSLSSSSSFSNNLSNRPKRNSIKTEEFTLKRHTKIPKNMNLISRYIFLFETGMKSKKDRIDEMAKEIFCLWSKFSFSIQHTVTIRSKLEKNLSKYETLRKRTKLADGRFLQDLFDVTQDKGEWLSSEDRSFYNLQISSCGQIGYCSSSTAPISSERIFAKSL